MEIRTPDVITASIRNPYMYKCILESKMKRTILYTLNFIHAFSKESDLCSLYKWCVFY